MLRLARLLITWLLLAAVPLQGWAMAARACHAAGESMPQASAHDHGLAVGGHALGHVGHHDDAAGQGDGEAQHLHHPSAHAPHGHGALAMHGDAAASPPPHDTHEATHDATHHAAGCSHCAACCVGALLPSPTQAPRLGPPAVLPAPQPDQPAWPFLTGGPERPPRAV